MTEQADSELVALARTGDKTAFGALVERHQALACRVARRMVASDELARELTQEALLAAYLSLAQLRDAARFKSWLCGIVLNVCRDYIRNQRINSLSLDALAGGLAFDAIPFDAPSPQELVEERELHRVVLVAVNALSDAEREATLLFYYDQLTLREIATALDISVVAVKGRLHKARQHLQAQLAPLVAERHKPMVSKERSKTMVKVTVVDVVRRERKDESQEQPVTMHVVVLHDAIGRRILPIWIGPWEAQAIAMRIGEVGVVRPLTFTFIANLLESVGATLEEVQVQALKDDTFYAIVKIRAGDRAREVDARPSDAIALALHVGSPIFVAEDLMERAGEAIPADVPELMPSATNIESLIASLTNPPKVTPPPPRYPYNKEEMEKSRQELIAYVFGRKT